MLKDRRQSSTPLCICRDQFMGDRCEQYLPCFELACQPGSTCHLELETGAVECKCVKPGFSDVDGKCVDVDECAAAGEGQRRGVCRENERCVNTPGSFECVCEKGFRAAKEEASSGSASSMTDRCVPDK